MFWWINWWHNIFFVNVVYFVNVLRILRHSWRLLITIVYISIFKLHLIKYVVFWLYTLKNVILMTYEMFVEFPRCHNLTLAVNLLIWNIDITMVHLYCHCFISLFFFLVQSWITFQRRICIVLNLIFVTCIDVYKFEVAFVAVTAQYFIIFVFLSFFCLLANAKSTDVVLTAIRNQDMVEVAKADWAV